MGQRVWIVTSGYYSDTKIMGVYSSLELAKAAAALYEEGDVDVEDGFIVDDNAAIVRTGMARWEVSIAERVQQFHRMGPATGEAASTREINDAIVIYCDARDAEHAGKIASDERARYLSR